MNADSVYTYLIEEAGLVEGTVGIIVVVAEDEAALGEGLSREGGFLRAHVGAA